jgi:hypothetical protein
VLNRSIHRKYLYPYKLYMNQGPIFKMYGGSNETDPTISTDESLIPQDKDCPFEYFEVLKDSEKNQITLMAKQRTKDVPDKTIFQGNEKYKNFDSMWGILKNVPKFNKCSNPLSNDSDYLAYKKTQTQNLKTSTEPQQQQLQDASQQTIDTTTTTTTDQDLNDLVTDATPQSKSYIDIVYVVKFSILFLLIMMFTTIIPREKLGIFTRILISLIVVILYGLIDIIHGSFNQIGKAICLNFV